MSVEKIISMPMLQMTSRVLCKSFDSIHRAI